MGGGPWGAGGRGPRFVPPGCPPPHVRRGQALANLGDDNGAKASYAAALKAYDARLAGSPGDPPAVGDLNTLTNKAFVLVLLGRRAEAAKLLEAPAKKAPGNASDILAMMEQVAAQWKSPPRPRAGASPPRRARP